MRRTLLPLTALVLGAGLVAPAAAQAAPSAPTIQRAWIAQDRGEVGVLDAGDVLKLRFTRNVVISDITSVGVDVTGDNGVTMRIENETSPYGAVFSVKGEVVTMRVNLDPEEYGLPAALTYPLTVSDTYNIVAKRGGAEVSVPGSRDVLID